jgi:glycine/D-amino acid oxidase-like deaminating enzyme
MRVIVCGGGVIGTSVAYFLSRLGAEVVVIERTEVACAASGKSGGFLALDWCDGSPLQRLARRSFELHASLAETLGGDWGYRRLATYSGSCEAGAVQSAGRHHLPWLASGVAIERRLGAHATTAQVHPAAFTRAMLRAAEDAGAELRIGTVTGLLRDGADRVRGVEVGGERVEGDAVVIAMGPWSMLASAWLDLPPVFGLKGHSLVLETGDAVPPEALFLEFAEARGGMLSPEVVPRPDGTTWVCAVSSDGPLPVDPADVVPDDGAMERLHAVCAAVSPALANAKVVARQACFRPVTQDGLPLIGAAPGLDNVYIATGHSVWGILNAPATGEALAELVVHGAERSVDLAAFDPARLPPLDPKLLNR